jgi:hypothetical protein
MIGRAGAVLQTEVVRAIARASVAAGCKGSAFTP